MLCCHDYSAPGINLSANSSVGTTRSSELLKSSCCIFLWSLVPTLPSLLVFSLSDLFAFLKYSLLEHSTVHALLPGKIPDAVNSPVGTKKIGVQISAGSFKKSRKCFVLKAAVFRRTGLHLCVYKRHLPSLGGR